MPQSLHLMTNQRFCPHLYFLSCPPPLASLKTDADYPGLKDEEDEDDQAEEETILDNLRKLCPDSLRAYCPPVVPPSDIFSYPASLRMKCSLLTHRYFSA